jgi:hypothetical protein
MAPDVSRLPTYLAQILVIAVRKAYSNGRWESAVLVTAWGREPTSVLRRATVLEPSMAGILPSSYRAVAAREANRKLSTIHRTPRQCRMLIDPIVLQGGITVPFSRC